MDDDFDDLLTPSPRRGRLTNAEREARAKQALTEQVRRNEVRSAGSGHAKIKVEDLKFLPVSQNWLADFFSMDPTTVRKRLKGKCNPAGLAGHNREVYLFHEAVPFLVKSKMTPAEFVKTLNLVDMPPVINNAFWTAQRTRIRYKLEAQEAWDTEDVLRFLGGTAMELKDALTMSVEEMRQRAKLSDEQCVLFEKMLDEMRENIAGRLLSIAERAETTSQYEKRLFGVAEDIDPDAGYLDGDDEE